MARPIRTLLTGLLAALALCAPLAGNEPPTALDLEQYRRDGSLGARVRAAKELGNHRPDPVLLEQARARLAARRTGAEVPTPPSGWAGMPTRGTVRMLVLLVDFSDYPHNEAQNSVAQVTSRIFGAGDGAAAAPYESLANYYRRSSYGQLELQGSVLGWYRASTPRASVPQTTAGRQALIKEALTSYNAAGHDFSVYDNNGDGRIDYFAVIWTGPDNGWSNFWWGYQTSFSDPSFTLDGKTLGKYSWQWESRPVGGYFTPLTLIHETGHALGLPDLYDYDATVGPRGGVGGLDMMDANRGDHNGFSKFVLDWLTPAVYTGAAGGVALRPAASFPDAAILMPDAVAGDPFQEYFLVQHRKRVGNDLAHPADGLLVWHIDARLAAGGADYLYDNSYAEHKLVRLMEADGLEEIERGLPANAGDYWTGGRSFGPQGTPSSARYNGLWTWMGITGIGTATDRMTFDIFALPPDTTPPTGAPGTPVPGASPDGSGNLAFTWTAGTAADPESTIAAYQLQVGTTPGGSDFADERVGTALSRAWTHAGQDGRTYYARVRALNGAGLASAWSGTSAGLRVQLAPVSCAALDACGLAFRTPADAAWTVTASPARTGGSSAQSAAIGDRSSTFLQTTLVGPGTFGYAWKVSSESGWDYLTFSIDGVVQSGISGEVDWALRSHALAAGPHTLRWTYTKDDNTAGGLDRAWVDQVTFTGGTAPAVTGFSPAGGLPGTAVTLRGTALTGATSATVNGVSATFFVADDTTVVATVPAGATSGRWAVTTPGGAALSVAAFTVASLDANGDGVSDILDLALLARAWSGAGNATAFPALDLDGDGDVDEQDLALFYAGAGL